jgi:hypothetical protein
LIQKFVAVLYRLDPTETAAVSGGGYNNTWNWTVPVNDSTQLGASSRREYAAVRVPCQIDRGATRADDGITVGGQVLRPDYVLTMHEPDLVAASLIDSDGRPAIFAGDRIGAIENLNGEVMQTFANPPGLFVVGTERAGYGLHCFGTPRTNLLLVYCEVPRVGGA